MGQRGAVINMCQCTVPVVKGVTPSQGIATCSSALESIKEKVLVSRRKRGGIISQNWLYFHSYCQWLWAGFPSSFIRIPSRIYSISFHLHLFHRYSISSISFYQHWLSSSSEPESLPFFFPSLCLSIFLSFHLFVSSVRSSNSHPDLLLIHHHPTPTFSDHTGPRHWTFTFWATTAI